MRFMTLRMPRARNREARHHARSKGGGGEDEVQRVFAEGGRAGRVGGRTRARRARASRFREASRK